MILLLPTKEYWFSKIHREIDGYYNTFYAAIDSLVDELMRVETFNYDDIVRYRAKTRDALGAKLLEIDRIYGTEFFINSYFYNKNTSKRISDSDLYHEFTKEYDCLLKEVTNRLK